MRGITRVVVDRSVESWAERMGRRLGRWLRIEFPGCRQRFANFEVVGLRPSLLPLSMMIYVISVRWEASQEAFARAAEFLGEVTPAGVGRWDEHALGEWNVRDLLGHATLALFTVESYVDRPATAVDVQSSADYFQRMTTADGASTGIAQRGRVAGVALGDDPVAAVAATIDRVPPKIRKIAADAAITTPAGGMLLADYLPTRTFELAVHTCDLAWALGQSIAGPEPVAQESFRIAGQLAARNGVASDLLLAATGRTTLPRDFSVLSEASR